MIWLSSRPSGLCVRNFYNAGGSWRRRRRLRPALRFAGVYPSAWRSVCSRNSRALFLAYGREVDLAALHQELWRQGRPLAVPRTQGLPAGIMQAVYLRSEDELTRTERGIAEPSAAAEPCPPEALAAVLLPGVAFDAQGGRLGQGGGYYDRFLARLSPQTLLIGVAYDWQLAPTLPQAAWDRPVQLLATDKRLLDCATKC